MKSKHALELEIKKHKQAVLIVNTHSRKGSDLYEHARFMLRQAGYIITASYRINDPSSMNRVFSKALASKPPLVIIGGGDGTISEVVDHLAYQDTVLGFIPLGTTNNFARSAGIPLEPSAAIENIIIGKVADVDLGKVNDDYFANVASIGLSVDVAASVSDNLKKRFGRMAYTYTAIKTLLLHDYFRVSVGGKNMKQHFYTHQLVVANGRSHAGREIARDASIDSHELVVFRMGGQSKLSLVTNTIRYALSREKSITQKSFTTARTVTIKTNPIQNIEIDGEIKAKTPATFSIAAEALKLMVPTNFEDR